MCTSAYEKSINNSIATLSVLVQVFRLKVVKVSWEYTVRIKFLNLKINYRKVTIAINLYLFLL